jgi:HSP20 family protein
MSELTITNRPDAVMGSTARSGVTFTPRFDIWEDESQYVLSGDLPGVTHEGLDIRFENHELTIWGKVAPRAPQGPYWTCEYGVGDYYRSFTVGDTVDAQAISAELKDGVLTVTLPKKSEVRARKIEVRSG